MRLILITTALLIAGGSAALASSIEPVSSAANAGGGSVVTISCAACPELKSVEAKKDYTVPTLAPGTQTTEIRDIDGEKKLARTEAWLGGSPVVFISKLPLPEARPVVALPAGEPQTDTAMTPSDGIDTEATTAAVDTQTPPVAATMTGEAPAPAPLNVNSFDLRLK